MAAASVIAVIVGVGYVSAKDAARGGDASFSSRGSTTRSVTRPRCPSARGAVAFYSSRVNYWLAKMGAARPGLLKRSSGRGCPRYLAHVLQRKAYGLRARYERWVAYHWHWWEWLPDKWQRIGACETGYGKRPGRWTWNSGTYQGAFGFYHGTWDQYKPRGAPSEAYLATPRQQYEAALNVAAVHGYGAWGCGGA